MAGGGTFLDVGSNFGLYTCPVAQVPGVECVAVDASAIAFAKLQDNLARNPAIAVRAVNVALATRHGLVALETPVPGNLGTTRVSGPSTGERCQTSYVGAMPLDTLLDALSLRSIKLMKIDVEGYELEVFRGMDLTSPRRPEHIIMEYSKGLDSDWHDLRGCLELLERHGYVARAVTGEAFDPSRPLPEENLWWSLA
jgi:FkbM family methyltransferase